MNAAVRFHTVAHRLVGAGPVGAALGRFVYHVSKALTSSDIDPMAVVDPTVQIPHATGVVIGATATVGARTVIMPGVVIGARSWDEEKRHADIGCDVFIGAGAKVIGAVSVGDRARVGANAVVLEDVPPGATVVGVPAAEVPDG